MEHWQPSSPRTSLFSLVSVALCSAVLWAAAGSTEAVAGQGNRQQVAPGPAIEDDPDATAQLAAIESELQQLNACSPECSRLLNELEKRFGLTNRLLELKRIALIRIQDWSALVDLERRVTADDASPDQLKRLAGALYQNGEYEQATQVLARISSSDPKDIDARFQNMVVLFQLGRHDAALESIAPVVDQLSPEQRSEVTVMMGLAALYRQAFADAETYFREALALTPDSPAGLNGLARVLMATDRANQAQVYSSRATTLRQATTLETRRRLRLSAQAKQTSAACLERSWDRCETLIQDMISIANQSERVGLFRYLARIFDLAGRSEEAEDALRTAEALAKNAEGKQDF